MSKYLVPPMVMLIMLLAYGYVQQARIIAKQNQVVSKMFNEGKRGLCSIRRYDGVYVTVEFECVILKGKGRMV